MMSGVIEISDDSNDSVEKSAPDVFAVVGTSDEDSPEQDSRHDYKPIFTTQSDNGASSSMNQKKQMLIKHLFPSLKEKKSANVVKHEKPSFLHEMMIRGVSVKMPIKPYGCQIALMSTLITAISKSENCILESPTGTGKTLALLCAALAWQQQEQNCFNQAQVQLAEALRNPNGGDIYSTPVKKFQDLRTSSSTPEKLFSKPIYGEKSIYDPIQNSAEGGDLNMKRKWEEWESPPENREPGLVTIHKKINTGTIDLTQGYPPSCSNMSSTPEKTSQETAQNRLQKNIKKESIDLTTGRGPVSSSSMSSTPEKTNEETTQNRRVPIIFYGTRTHKQLEQVIKEFKRTHYCGQIKMTILSSREHSCIRQFDRSQWATKDDMCRACVKKQQTVLNGEKVPSNCTYYENRAALNHGTLPPAFNLEELVAMGDDLVACPYYAARQMAAKAEIVFCPYNYIIEPGIRKSMNINLYDNILIIDEAHNIEDVCREAATFIIHVEQIAAALKELEIASMYRYASKGADTYMDILKKALDKWQYWFETQRPLVETQPVKMGKATFTWQYVTVFAKTLDDHNIGRANYSEFSQNAQQFCRQFNEDPRSLIGVSQSTCNLLETIDTILGYLFRNSGEAMDDFAPVLFLKPAQNRKGRDMLGLHMICLNPGVVFDGLRSTRCVALASGTLSPRGALAAELGAPFPHAVSPPHVVPPERVWIGIVRTGSNSTSLQLTWQGTQQASVRDALGDTILRACRLTPHGVLCFMPSYRLMNDLHTRWQQTGLWHNLIETKHVFMESQNVLEHNDVMEEFYEKVATEKGAILFGVFRGKAAEGMDFRDRQARLVIAVGIPYPNVEDPAVKEKRKYNDRHESRGLLRGSEWYSTQAYRALNQALGRCIRHRADWGGALLLDERYAQPQHTAHLPAWLRNQVVKKTPYTYDGLVQEDNGLQMFMEDMTLNDQEDI